MNTDAHWLEGLGSDHESNVQLIATLILLREGDPLAEEFLAPPMDDAWEFRLAFLRRTAAWRAAERMLTERHHLI